MCIAKKDIEKLKRLGFAFDEETVWQEWHGGWSGTIDPIGKFSIGDECMGLYVEGPNKREMVKNAFERATHYQPQLQPCHDPDCKMHGE